MKPQKPAAPLLDVKPETFAQQVRRLSRIDYGVKSLQKARSAAYKAGSLYADGITRELKKRMAWVKAAQLQAQEVSK